MTRKKDWLIIAARAHEALVQHHRLLTDEARRGAADAEQQSLQAAKALANVITDWTGRRKHAELDPTLDQAYVAYHGQLARQANDSRAKHQQAEAEFSCAAAQLGSVHGTSRVLDELLERRASEQDIQASKTELQTLTESWLFASQHQKRDRSE